MSPASSPIDGIPFLREWQLPAPVTPWGCSFDLSGVYLLVMIPSRVAPGGYQGFVPGGFRTPVTGDGSQRNILSFGLQQFVRPVWSPPSISFTYLECIAGLPGLLQDGSPPAPQRYSVMMKLYLDNWLATVLGKLMGLPKVRAEIRSRPEGMEILAEDGQPLIRAEFRPRGPTMNPTRCPSWAPYAEMFGQMNLSPSFFGPLLGITVRFSLRDALLQSVSARIVSNGSTLPGLKPGENCFPGIDEDPVNGALQLRLPWRMSWPKIIRR